MGTTSDLRMQIHRHTLIPEEELVAKLVRDVELDSVNRTEISKRTSVLVTQLRNQNSSSFLQSFLGEYGLSSEEGVALMSMAEAFLRVPDAATLDELIAEKISGSNWQSHSGQAPSFLVNASTWALMLTGRLLTEDQQAGLVSSMRQLLKRLGEPVVRVAMTEAMEQLGNHFVIGESIGAAVRRAADKQAKGYCFSFDMLGESALTEADASRYFEAYQDAIMVLAENATADIKSNSGISVKLSALHPRFELLQKSRSFEPILERLMYLSRLAADNDLSLNIDGEEAERQEFTLDIFQAIAKSSELSEWQGLGMVVQTYARNSHAIIDWLIALARKHNKHIMVRLVKGAYWDTEIKRAQVLGLETYPVYTRKYFTDVSYITAAKKLLHNGAGIYPQFATHNAHTMSAIMVMAEKLDLHPHNFEFQRLYGMGQDLHESIKQQYNTRHRIYAPVGEHEDLLAYLVRRLLENGANSSFVHQLTDESVSVDVIAADPFIRLQEKGLSSQPGICSPSEIYSPRVNSNGWDLSNTAHLALIDTKREPWRRHCWSASPLLANKADSQVTRDISNPADPGENRSRIGSVEDVSDQDLHRAFEAAVKFRTSWAATTVTSRAQSLLRTADLLEKNFGEMLAILMRESGKTIADAIGEWREAIDFLRYYAQQAQRQDLQFTKVPRGIFVCISPWNFPLSIFTGQIAAALVTGNAVMAKPAEQSTLVAYRMTQFFHEAGIPVAALQLVTGDGGRVGAALCSDPRLNGVCVTGSLDTAKQIHTALAANAAVGTALIAETGGINAMIVDSTALPEQTVRDIITSAYSSAGQRCSALRILYLQEEIADRFLQMLIGAMNSLHIGDPWNWETDVGPVIDVAAQSSLNRYIEEQRLLHQIPVPDSGCYVSPVVIEVSGITDIKREIFGPVLHVARYRAENIDKVIAEINGSGYGLTFSIHSRLTQRVDRCINRLKIGNIYVNRNQIGAVVESQPFGGRGLSGTGPKAGGPHYLQAFLKPVDTGEKIDDDSTDEESLPIISPITLQKCVSDTQPNQWASIDDRLALLQRVCPDSKALATCNIRLQSTMPGPTGERNIYQLQANGCSLCLGEAPAHAIEQALQALAFGGSAVICCAPDARLQQQVAELGKLDAPIALLDGRPANLAIEALQEFSLLSWYGNEETGRQLLQALAAREGAIIRLVTELIDPLAYVTECHVCNDITSSGGNVELMFTAQC